MCRRLAAPLAAASLLTLAPARADGQDVVELARQANQPVPAALLDRIQQEPGIFEFRRAWRNRVRQIRQNRAALEASAGPMLSPAELGPALAAVTGTLMVPTLGALYMGQLPLHTAGDYLTRLFGEAVAPAYSARTFYREMSRGVFEVGGIVPAWPELPSDADFYRPSFDTDPQFGRSGEFIRDVLDASDATVDFAQFDNDGPDGEPDSGDDDGYVDVVAFLYQDAPASCGGPGIWPHRWVYEGWWGTPYTTADIGYDGSPILVSDYMIQAGVGCDGASLMEIGTFSHELGHALALPDLYDTDSGNGFSEGVGHWDLMGSGNWNTQDSPAHMGAWSKDFLGWLTVDPLVPTPGPGGGPTPVSVTDIELPSVDGGTVLRHDLPGGGEYFLLEHREAIGSDVNLAGPGLLIWHIDQPVIDANVFGNRVNADHTRYGVDLEEADGLFDLDNGFDRGDAGDPFPGTSGNTAFGPAATPSSHDNDGLPSGVTVSNIALAGATLTFDVDVSDGPIVVAPELVAVSSLNGEVHERSVPVALNDGSTVGLRASATQAWLAVTPDTTDTPATLTLTFDATGLDDGEYHDTVTLTSDLLGEDHEIAAVLRIPGGIIALDDVVVDSLTPEAPQDTFQIDLTAGQRVDVVMYSPDFSLDTYLEVLSPEGDVLAFNDDFRDSWSLIAGFEAPADGRYGVVARAFCCGFTGNYELYARTAGPVVDPVVGSFFSLSGPEGGTAVDTVWLANAGEGPTTFETSSELTWLTFSPSSGPVPVAQPELVDAFLEPRSAASEKGTSGSERDDRRRDAQPQPLGERLLVLRGHGVEPPPGAVAVEVSADLTAAALGLGDHFFVEAFSITSPDDPFPNTDSDPLDFELDIRVHDASIVTLVTGLGFAVGDIDRHPLGGIVAATAGSLERVDPDTGDRSLHAGGVSGSSGGLRGLASGQDGTVYVIDTWDYTLERVLPDGSSEEVWSNGDYPVDVTVATPLAPDPGPAAAPPSQTLYVTDESTGLWRIDTDGTTTNVATGLGSGYGAVHFNPADGQVYYSWTSQIHRYDPGSGDSEFLFSVADFPLDLEVGASGRFYVAFRFDLRVYDAAGVELDVYVTPGVTPGLALDSNRLLAATSDNRNGNQHRGTLFAIPVDDSPVVGGGTFLVADWPTISVPLGGSTMETIDIEAQDGSAIAVNLVWSETWLEVVPQSPSPPGPLTGATEGTTPLGFDVTVDASDLPFGTHTATIEVTSAGADNSPYQIPVTLFNGNLLSIPSEVTGTLTDGDNDRHYFVDLTAGVPVDIYVVTADPGAFFFFDVYSPAEEYVGGGWAIGNFRFPAAGLVAATDGRYRIEVSGDLDVEYVLGVRFAGPVASATPASWIDLSAPEGGSATETFFLVNVGTGPTTFTASSSLPWVSLSPGSGALPASAPEEVATLVAALRAAGPGEGEEGTGPTEPARAFRAFPNGPGEAPSGLVLFRDHSDFLPSGAIPIEVTADFAAAGFEPGAELVEQAIDIAVPDDPFGGLTVDFQAWVYDPATMIVEEGLPYRTGDMARLPDGGLAHASGGDVFRIDPATGERTLIAAGVSPAEWGLFGLAAGLDGSIYVVDMYDNEVKKIDPIGNLTTVWSASDDILYDVAVAPDGTVYAVGWLYGLWRIDPTSPPGPPRTYAPGVNVATGDFGHYSGVFNPMDGRVYYSSSDGLFAYDPATGASERVGEMWDVAYDLEVGASGLVYAHHFDGIRGYGVGSLFERVAYAHPGWGWGIALVEDALWGSTSACCGVTLGHGVVYQMPVPDGPVEPGGRYLVSDPLRTVVVLPDGTEARTVEVRASDGGTLDFTVVSSEPWLTVTPDESTTPAELEVTFSSAGMPAGRYEAELLLESASADAPHRRFVTMDVPAVMAIGDELVGSIPPDRGVGTQLLSLTAGDQVDLVAIGDPGAEDLRLRLERPDGTLARDGTVRSTPQGAAVMGYTADATGLYQVRVAGDAGTPYTLKSRVAGDAVVSDPHALNFWSPDGSAVLVDTIWLFNTGSGSPTWELAGTVPSWLSFSVTGGTLAPAAEPWAGPPVAAAEAASVDPTLMALGPQPITRRPPPSGATPVIVTADPSGLDPDEDVDVELEFSIVGDDWAGHQPVAVDLRVVDPDVTVLTPIPYRLMDLLVYSPTELVATTGRDLWKIDRETGAATAWVPLLGDDAGFYSSPLLGIEHTGDGGLFVADQSAKRILRVEPDGSSSVAMELPSTTYDPVVLPGGALIAATFQGFFRLEHDGAVEQIASDVSCKRATYNPLDGWIYYGTMYPTCDPDIDEGTEVKRLHPVTGEIEVLDETDEQVTDLQIAQNGTFHLLLRDGEYVVIDPATLDAIFESGDTEEDGFGIALGDEGDGVVYLASQGRRSANGHIYSRATADWRAPVPATAPALVFMDDVVAFAGETVTVGVYSDLSLSGKALGGFDALLRWDTELASLISMVPADFVGEVEINTANAAEGEVAFAALNADDTQNAGVTKIAEATFVLGGTGGQSWLFDLAVESIEATDFTNLHVGLEVRNGRVTLALGSWGDPNRDGVITALDALMCLATTVDRELPEGSDATACDVAPDVDSDVDGVRETFDGTVTSLDALAILSAVVLKELPVEFRVGGLR